MLLESTRHLSDRVRSVVTRSERSAVRPAPPATLFKSQWRASRESAAYNTHVAPSSAGGEIASDYTEATHAAPYA